MVRVMVRVRVMVTKPSGTGEEGKWKVEEWFCGRVDEWKNGIVKRWELWECGSVRVNGIVWVGVWDGESVEVRKRSVKRLKDYGKRLTG